MMGRGFFSFFPWVGRMVALLQWGSLSLMGPALAVTPIDPENFMVGYTPDPPGQIFYQVIKPDADEVFHVSFDPKLSKEGTQCFLFQDRRVLAFLWSRDHTLFVEIDEGANFFIHGVLDEQKTLETLPFQKLRIRSQGNFLGFQGGLATHTYLLSKTITLLHGVSKHFVIGDLKESENPKEEGILLPCERCELHGETVCQELHLHARSFQNRGWLNTTRALLEVQEGVDLPESRMQAQDSLVLRGFDRWRHQGEFRVLGALMAEGKAFVGEKNSFSFVGALYQMTLETYESQERLLAAHCQIVCQKNADLRRFFWYRGRSFSLSAQGVLRMEKEALLSPLYGAHLYGLKALYAQGDLRALPEGPSLASRFPYHAYDHGPLWPLPLSQEDTFQRNHLAPVQDISWDRFAERQEAARKKERALSLPSSPSRRILLASQGPVTVKGKRSTLLGSMDLQGIDIVSEGHQASGRAPGDHSSFKGTQGRISGTLDAQTILFDFEQKVTSTATVHAEKTTLSSPLAVVGGHWQTSLTVPSCDAFHAQGTLSGSFCQMVAGFFHQTTGSQCRFSDFFTLEGDQLLFQGESEAGHVSLRSREARWDPGGHMAMDQGSFVVSEDFDNRGNIISQGDLAVHLGQRYDLGNLRAKDWLTLSAPDALDLDEVFDRQGTAYEESGGLRVITPTPQHLRKSRSGQRGLGVVAPSLRVSAPLHSHKAIELESNGGDMVVTEALAAPTITLLSGGSLDTWDVRATRSVLLSAMGAYGNHGSVRVRGGEGTLTIQAARIENLFEHSVLQGHDVRLDAWRGDIKNRGLIQGMLYLELQAVGDILTMGTAHHGGTPWFHKAQLLGGSGIVYHPEDGPPRRMGLYIKGRCIQNHVSDIIAWGDIYLEGHMGIFHKGDSITYMAEQYTKSKGLFGFRKETHTVWRTVVGTPVVHSKGGRLVSYAPQGPIHYVGAQVMARHGDYAVARDKIGYGYIPTYECHEVRGSSWWGMSRFHAKESHRGGVPTVFVNGLEIDHESLTKGIHGQGVQFSAPILRFKAKDEILFEGIPYEHVFEQRQWGLTPQFFLSRAFENALSGQGWPGLIRGIAQEDPLLNILLNERPKPSHEADVMAQNVQDAVHVYAHAKKLKKLFDQEDPLTFSAYFKQTYGDVGMRWHDSHVSHVMKGTMPSVFHADILEMTSAKGVTLSDGAQAHVRQLFKVRAPSLKLRTAVHETQFKQRSCGVEVGVNVFTGLPHGSVDASVSRHHQKIHDYAVINVYGENGLIDLGDMDVLDLDGGLLFCTKIRGHVKKARFLSHQNTQHHESEHMNLGAKKTPRWVANVAYAREKGDGQTTEQHGGIYAKDTEAFHINDLHIRDTQRHPAMEARADHVTFEPLKDHQKSQGFGFSFSFDVSSPESFTREMKKTLMAAGVGSAVGMALQQLGIGDGWSSLAGSVASGLATDQFNWDEAKTPKEGMPPKEEDPLEDTWADVGILGNVSFEKNGRKLNVTLLDVETPALKTFRHQATKLKEHIIQALDPENEEEKAAAQKVCDIADETLSVVKETQEKLEALEEKRERSQKKKKDQKTNASQTPQDPFAFLDENNPLHQEIRVIAEEITYQQELKKILEEAQAKVDAMTLWEEWSGLYADGKEACAQVVQDLRQSFNACVEDFKADPKGFLLDMSFEVGDFVADMFIPGGTEAVKALYRGDITAMEAVVLQAKNIAREGVSGFAFKKVTKPLKKLNPLGQKFMKKFQAIRDRRAEEGLGKIINHDKLMTKAQKKEQPWSVRPGQEWKSKIFGRAQKTGTDGHAQQCYNIAAEYAKRPDVEKVYLNRGYRKITDVPVTPNRRPDVTVVMKDGTVHPFEVPSKTDKVLKLKERNEEAMRQLPKEKEGKYKEVNINDRKWKN